ncbi:substrate-binding domain-containing protein [Methylocapsa acidiphila]|uniref:substrate-binding domain-containing protein n=1 Tax=Methylocapsa acidiphila TaxID=133552 RepID=UPI00040761BB|nr:substrate-binding domain-containing protein [Methylocapsa acidiphila]
MSTKKNIVFAASVLAAAAVTSGPAQATSINIAVAANFAGAIAALAAQFLQTAPYSTKGYSVSYTSDSSAVLLAAIQNHTASYDLFLSADATRPNTLTASPNLQSTGAVGTCTTTCGIGAPFLYAVGELELWSPTLTTVASGLPTTGVPPFSPAIVIADPSKAPYGFAAQQVLAHSPWSLPRTGDPTVSCKDPNSGATATCLSQATSEGLYEQSNISLTYSAIKSAVYSSGFIAQSSICKANASGVKTFSGYHHTYAYNDSTYSHGKISQYGISITSNAAGTELADFLTFMNSATGQAIIKSFCYSLS